MQQTAELWIVLSITGSGLALGLHSLLRFGPVLLFGAFGGVLTDRFNRRRLLLITQSLQCFAAGTLAIVSWISSPSLLIIYSMVALQGLTNALDNPLRRTFIRDLTTDDELSNAVSLDSTISTVTRTIGPALGGLVIAAVGPEWCFSINALSFGFVLVALLRINPATLRHWTPIGRNPGQLRAGLRYAWNSRLVRSVLGLATVVSIFAWNWSTLMPGYAAMVLGGDASLFGSMISILSVGSFVGAVLSARVARPKPSHLLSAGATLAGSLWCVATASMLPVAFIGVALLGASGTTFTISSQALLQINIRDDMSGRIMSLWSVVFVGSKPVGGLLGGWMMDAFNPRVAFAVGGTVVALVIGAAALRMRNLRTLGGVLDTEARQSA